MEHGLRRGPTGLRAGVFVVGRDRGEEKRKKTRKEREGRNPRPGEQAHRHVLARSLRRLATHSGVSGLGGENDASSWIIAGQGPFEISVAGAPFQGCDSNRSEERLAGATRLLALQRSNRTMLLGFEDNSWQRQVFNANHRQLWGLAVRFVCNRTPEGCITRGAGAEVTTFDLVRAASVGKTKRGEGIERSTLRFHGFALDASCMAELWQWLRNPQKRAEKPLS